MRIPLSIVWVAMLPVAIVINLGIHGGLEEAAFVIGACLFGQCLLVQVTLWGLAMQLRLSVARVAAVMGVLSLLAASGGRTTAAVVAQDRADEAAAEADVGVQDPPWGETLNGLQFRLRTERTTWQSWQQPIVVVEWNAYKGHAQHSFQLTPHWKRISDAQPLELAPGKSTARLRVVPPPGTDRRRMVTSLPVEFRVLGM